MLSPRFSQVMFKKQKTDLRDDITTGGGGRRQHRHCLTVKEKGTFPQSLPATSTWCVSLVRLC